MRFSKRPDNHGYCCYYYDFDYDYYCYYYYYYWIRTRQSTWSMGIRDGAVYPAGRDRLQNVPVCYYYVVILTCLSVCSGSDRTAAGTRRESFVRTISFYNLFLYLSITSVFFFFPRPSDVLIPTGTFASTLASTLPGRGRSSRPDNNIYIRIM